MSESKLQYNHFKMCTPDETVNKIKSILNNYGIEVEAKGECESSIQTNSLRLVIKGTDIGTNGKGVSMPYATASAYAEFMERLENQHLNSFAQLPDRNDLGFYLFPDEKVVHVDDLLKQNDAFLSFYMKTSNLDREDLLKINYLDFCKLDKKDSLISLPFWDYNDDRCVYLSYSMYRPWYGSNGMCAGNSPAEALVQGMSELYERLAMKRIFEEKVALPEIPEEYIRKYPYIYERLQNIKKCDRYKVKMLDCSFGGDYPVAGLLLIEKNTGNYGLKLGCHPDYGIAMERTLTEASQGQDIFDFASCSYLDFANEEVFSEMNLAHCFMTGEGQYPYQFFGDKPEYSFFEPNEVVDKTNEELLKEMITKIQSWGYHVLIRDVSYLGFPAFHIIIPGVSETGTATVEDYEMLHRLNKSIELFRNPELVNEKNAEYLMQILEHYSYQQYISFFMRTEKVDMIPFENVGESVHYYKAALSIAMGRYEDAINLVTMISEKVSMNSNYADDLEWLLAMTYYLSAKGILNEHEKIMSYIKQFFSNELCEKLDKIFGKKYEGDFDSALFCSMVAKYVKNEKDRYIEQVMSDIRKNMYNKSLIQRRII